jgi:hypothetical protein
MTLVRWSLTEWPFSEFDAAVIEVAETMTHTKMGNVKTRVASVRLRRREGRRMVEVRNFLMGLSPEIPAA